MYAQNTQMNMYFIQRKKFSEQPRLCEKQRRLMIPNIQVKLRMEVHHFLGRAGEHSFVFRERQVQTWFL